MSAPGPARSEPFKLTPSFVTLNQEEQRIEQNSSAFLLNNRTENPFLHRRDLIDPRMQASLLICETTLYGIYI